MDKSSNEIQQLAPEGMKLIQSLAGALLAWTSVPPSIIQTTVRPEAMTAPQRLLVRSVRKFCDDFGAALVLLRNGFVGPSHAILRMCRENIVSMLFLALATQSEAKRFARFIAEQKPADTRLKLHGRVTKLLGKSGEKLPATARDRLSAAILDEKQIRADQAAATQDAKASADYTFNKLVARIAEVLERDHGSEARTFLTAVIDYHIESEVTHSGFDAIAAYHVETADWRSDLGRIVDILRSLLDLRVMTIFASNALLDAFGASGRIPKPEAVLALGDLASVTRQYLERLATRPPKS